MKAGWQIKRLGDLSDLITKGTTPTSIGHAFVSEGINFIKVESISENGQFIENKFAHITQDCHDALKRSQLKDGDILFSIAGALGRTALVIETILPANINQALAIIRLKKTNDVLPAFVLKTLETGFLLEQIEKFKGGVAQQNLSLAQVQEFQIPLPPLSEQQRIVGIIDEAFDGIAAAKASAEKNLQNARALFESHLQSVFTQRGEGWVEKPLDELIESNVIGLTKSSRDQGENKAWPYVKMNNITRDNRFAFSSFTCVDATDEEVGKFSLRDGDLLFNTRNSYELVGKSCIYKSDSNDVVLFNNNIMRVRFKSCVDARFVLLAFSSKPVADELNALKSGTTNVSAIYFKDLKSLVIPVPPIAMQKAIAAKLESLSEETQCLESIYERKIAALDKLKKSLLHQAFTGEL